MLSPLNIDHGLFSQTLQVFPYFSCEFPCNDLGEKHTAAFYCPMQKSQGLPKWLDGAWPFPPPPQKLTNRFTNPPGPSRCQGARDKLLPDFLVWAGNSEELCLGTVDSVEEKSIECRLNKVERQAAAIVLARGPVRKIILIVIIFVANCQSSPSSKGGEIDFRFRMGR